MPSYIVVDAAVLRSLALTPVIDQSDPSAAVEAVPDSVDLPARVSVIDLDGVQDVLVVHGTEPDLPVVARGAESQHGRG